MYVNFGNITGEHEKGIGTAFLQFSIQCAKERGCHLVQLTTDKKREDALRFYEEPGFIATHEGMKMKLRSR